MQVYLGYILANMTQITQLTCFNIDIVSKQNTHKICISKEQYHLTQLNTMTY